jgi:hypothetical protein
MSILTCSSHAKSYGPCGTFWLKAKKLLQRIYRQHGRGSETGSRCAETLELPSELYLTPQIETSSPCMLGLQTHFSEGGWDARSTLIRSLRRFA